MLPSILLYAALLATLIGLASLVRPFRRLGVRTRPRALLVVLVAVVLALGTICAPVRPTRVFGTDDRAIRRFLPYWRVILPGSAILRVTWLQAISRRARSM